MFSNILTVGQNLNIEIKMTMNKMVQKCRVYVSSGEKPNADKPQPQHTLSLSKRGCIDCPKHIFL